MRHEYKHRITYVDYLAIKERLTHLAAYDRNVLNRQTYQVNSLYFDTWSDKALREKLDGVDKREKFRIRYYDDNLSYIRLEKKIKVHGLCGKYSAPLSGEDVIRICRGEFEFLKERQDLLLKELYAKMRYQLLRPKTIVRYDREPFVYGPGNVRITFDSNIRTGLYHNSLFDGNEVSVPVEPGLIIMEVKYDAYLPEIMAMAVKVPNRYASPFSKYAVSRIYD